MGNRKKTGEESNWESLTRPRPDPPSEDGATKKKTNMGSKLEGKPPVGGGGGALWKISTPGEEHRTGGGFFSSQNPDPPGEERRMEGARPKK